MATDFTSLLQRIAEEADPRNQLGTFEPRLGRTLATSFPGFPENQRTFPPATGPGLAFQSGLDAIDSRRQALVTQPIAPFRFRPDDETNDGSFDQQDDPGIDLPGGSQGGPGLPGTASNFAQALQGLVGFAVSPMGALAGVIPGLPSPLDVAKAAKNQFTKDFGFDGITDPNPGVFDPAQSFFDFDDPSDISDPNPGTFDAAASFEDFDVEGAGGRGQSISDPGEAFGEGPGAESGEGEGGDDSVICTTLYDMGMLPKAIYEYDNAYGKTMSCTVIAGYHFWAKPLTRLMRRNRLALWIAYFLGHSWAKEVAWRAGCQVERPVFGRWLHMFGVPICRMIGKMLLRRRRIIHA